MSRFSMKSWLVNGDPCKGLLIHSPYISVWHWIYLGSIYNPLRTQPTRGEMITAHVTCVLMYDVSELINTGENDLSKKKRFRGLR